MNDQDPCDLKKTFHDSDTQAARAYLSPDGPAKPLDDYGAFLSRKIEEGRRLVPPASMTRRQALRMGLAGITGLAVAMTVGGLPSTALAQSVSDGVQSVDTIAALKAYNVSTIGTTTSNNTVLVLGYYAPGDGGGGLFQYSSSATTADDGGSVIAPTTGSGRWLRRRLGDVASIKWFGARGDGTTDDAARIQAAVNWANTANVRNLFVPPVADSYRTTTTVTLPANVRLFGVGYASCIKMTSSSGTAPDISHPNILSINGSDVIIESLRLQGPNVIDGYYPSNSQLSYGIYGANTHNRVRIRDNFIHGCIFAGMYLFLAGDTEITGNILWENNGGKSYDISVSGNGNTGALMERIRITDNFCLSNSDLGIALGVPNALAKETLVARNHIVSLRAGIPATGTACLRRHSVVISYPNSSLEQRVVVDSNVMRFTKWSGVYAVQGANSFPGPFVVTNNHISDFGYEPSNNTPAPLQGGVNIAAMGKADVVVGNVIQRSANAVVGVKVTLSYGETADTRCMLIAFNSISECEQGVWIINSGRNVHVAGNMFYANRANDIRVALATSTTQDYKLLITGNVFRRTATSEAAIFINQQSSATVVKVDGNQFYGADKTVVNNAGNTPINLQPARVQFTNNLVKNFYNGFWYQSYISVRQREIQIDYNRFEEIGGTAIPLTRSAVGACIVHEGNQFVNCNAILGNAGFLGQIDGDKFTVFSSGIPGIGTWQAGDRAWNTNPAVGQPVGWVYTTSWRSMGNLA